MTSNMQKKKKTVKGDGVLFLVVDLFSERGVNWASTLEGRHLLQHS